MLARLLIQRRAAIAVLASCSVLACSARTQQSIHVNVNLTNVAFSARDANGALVDNLTRDDVEVLEDAVPQKVSFFARSTDVPLTLGLIVDDSGSQSSYTKKHEHDLEIFLKEVLGPKDRVFLICFENKLKVASDFSSSPQEVIERLHNYGHKSKGLPEIGPHESRDLGTAFYDAIFYSVTEKLATESGRKALLIFSDGEDNSSSHNMMTAIEAAQSENVQLFAIRYTEKSHGELTARNKYGISVMDRIARETGGMHIDAEADPHTYFRQIAEELRSSYELAYYPENPSKDDTFRKIVIRPKKDGLKVRAKTGYFSR